MITAEIRRLVNGGQRSYPAVPALLPQPSSYSAPLSGFKKLKN